MAKHIVALNGTSFNEIADDAHRHEITGSLEGFITEDGTNYGIYEEAGEAPADEIIIRPAFADSPADVVKIGQGTLTIHGVAVDVTAFRCETLPDRGDPPGVP